MKMGVHNIKKRYRYNGFSFQTTTALDEYRTILYKKSCVNSYFTVSNPSNAH